MAKFGEHPINEQDTTQQLRNLVNHLNSIQSFNDEYGDNYIKFGNGILQCWGKQSITPTVIDVPKSQVITFPETFIATPDSVIVTAQSSTPYTGTRECTCIPNSTTQATIYLTRADLVATNVSWFAIGKWK